MKLILDEFVLLKMDAQDNLKIDNLDQMIDAIGWKNGQKKKQRMVLCRV